MPDVRQVQVTFDCADPKSLAGFWIEVLGYKYDDPPQGFDTWEAALEAFGVPKDEWNSRSACSDPNGVGPRLFFQRVPEGKTAKNRVHLDVRTAPDLRGEERMTALEAECARLVGLGATRMKRFEPESSFGEIGFIVMQDPEGNEFCLD